MTAKNSIRGCWPRARPKESRPFSERLLSGNSTIRAPLGIAFCSRHTCSSTDTRISDLKRMGIEDAGRDHVLTEQPFPERLLSMHFECLQRLPPAAASTSLQKGAIKCLTAVQCSHCHSPVEKDEVFAAAKTHWHNEKRKCQMLTGWEMM